MVVGIVLMQKGELMTDTELKSDENKIRARLGFCKYCHEDSDGYVTPLEKNCHAFVSRSPIDGWVLSMKYGAWRKDIPIRFCPMCGRKL